MRTARIFVDAPLSVGATLSLDAKAHHRVAHVLRTQPGQSLVVFNGWGGEYQATLDYLDRRTSIVSIGTYYDCERESHLRSTLLQGICARERMDFALQKCAELGITSIQPLHCARSSMTPDTKRLKRRMSHWKSVIVSACEQSGRTRVPELLDPLTLQEGLLRVSRDPAIAMDPSATRTISQLEFGFKSVVLLIGPEGGLTDQELALSERAGFTRITLGPRTLRAETAAAAALAILQALSGDLA